MIITTRSQYKRLALTFAGILCLFVTNVESQDFGYNYMGNDWKGLCASGKRQSPIDIPTRQVGRDFAGDKSQAMKRFLQSDSSSASITLAQPSGVTIAAPTVITTTCASSTTSETCSQEGLCCAFANRTTGNTPNTALNSNVCVPSQISGQSFNISGVEFQFNCNFAQTVARIEVTEKACSSNDQCGTTQCCAIRSSEMRTVTAGNSTAFTGNYPPRRYCIEKTKAGSQFWLRYAAGTPNHNLNHDLAVQAQCMETATFQKLETLQVRTVQSLENNAVIDNQQSTIITTFLQTVGTYLNLTDEDADKPKVFTPLQLHFHAPSEHTFNGKHYDLELHIVNANTDKSQLSVLGILFDVEDGGSQSNWFIEQVLQNGTNLNTPSRFNAATLDVKRYVDSIDKKKLYHYNGSLTTPGCAEIVEWIVLDNLQNISPQQLAAFTSKWAGRYSFGRGYGNARVTQPMNGRTIYWSFSFNFMASLTVAFISIGMIFLA